MGVRWGSRLGCCKRALWFCLCGVDVTIIRLFSSGKFVLSALTFCQPG